MNYKDVKTFSELAEAIKEDINSHKVPCQDSTTGEASMQLFTSLKTDDARLAFIWLKNKFGVELPVPDGDLMNVLAGCVDAERELQDKSEVEPSGIMQNTPPAKRCWIRPCVKKIPRWIYVLVIFCAALLTCIYLFWWLWTTFWKK